MRKKKGHLFWLTAVIGLESDLSRFLKLSEFETKYNEVSSARPQVIYRAKFAPFGPPPVMKGLSSLSKASCTPPPASLAKTS